MKHELLRRVIDARAAGMAVALVTDLASGRQCMITEDRVEGDLLPDFDAVEELRRRAALDRAGTVELPSGPVFLEVLNPPLRMVVVGAVHIAQTLVPLAAMAGYRVTVIDPRGAFATAERFPDADRRVAWPDEALPAMRIDHRTAVVTLSHDPKIDDPALRSALGSAAFYIGALGSHRTHAKRLDRLHEAGFETSATGRIRAPVGLAIGAVTPAEIAISIMGEVTATLRQRVAP